jgi:hypothetical protein
MISGWWHCARNYWSGNEKQNKTKKDPDFPLLDDNETELE